MTGQFPELEPTLQNPGINETQRLKAELEAQRFVVYCGSVQDSPQDPLRAYALVLDVTERTVFLYKSNQARRERWEDTIAQSPSWVGAREFTPSATITWSDILVHPSTCFADTQIAALRDSEFRARGRRETLTDEERDEARAIAFALEGERHGFIVKFESKQDRRGRGEFGDTMTGLVTDPKEVAELLQELNEGRIEEWQRQLRAETDFRMAHDISLDGITARHPKPKPLTRVSMVEFFSRGYACHGMTRMEALELAQSRYRHRRAARQER